MRGEWGGLQGEEGTGLGVEEQAEERFWIDCRVLGQRMSPAVRCSPRSRGLALDTQGQRPKCSVVRTLRQKRSWASAL